MITMLLMDTYGYSTKEYSYQAMMFVYPYIVVLILPSRGVDNEELVKHTNSRAGRSTKRKHRTDENNEE